MLPRRWPLLALAVSFTARAQEKLSLEEAVRRALRHNVNAQVAAQEIRRAEGIVKEARSPALPQLTGNATGTRLDADRRLASGALVAGRDQLSANLQLSLPIFAPQRWLAWAHASEQVDVARASAEDVARGVAVSTARAYLGVMAQHRLIQINTQARDVARVHLEDAKARFEVGTGNRLDQVRAGQELATDEANLASARVNLARSMEALAALLGEDQPVDATEQIALPPAPVPEIVLKDAEELRADLRAQRQRTEAARKVLRDSWADYLPLLTAVAQPFYQNPPTLTQPQTGWQAQLVLTLPLYDGGARYGLQRERSALYEEAKAQLDQALRQARADVRLAFEEVRRADESLGSAREAARLAREALDMTVLAYREGATNDLEVVDAERRARDADTAVLAAEDASRQARIDLLAASGRFP